VVDSITVGGKANLNADVNIQNRLFAQNDVFLYRDITTSAAITAGSLTATGFIKGNYQNNAIPRTAISSYGDFFQDSTFSERIFVGKDASFNGHAAFGDVSFNKNVSFASGSIPSSAIEGGVNVDFSNDISMNKRLFINGDVSFNSNLYLGADASLNKNLAVAGDSTMAGTLGVTGNHLTEQLLLMQYLLRIEVFLHQQLAEM
jgi:hypothetical protein